MISILSDVNLNYIASEKERGGDIQRLCYENCY